MPQPFATRHLILPSLLAALCSAALACSEGDDDTGSNAAGSSGTLAAGSGGMPSSGGSSGASGMIGVAGSAGASGSMSAAGTTAAGSSGSGSAGTIAAGSSSDAGVDAGSAAGSDGGGGCPYQGEGATARFSFFVTSQEGLERLSGSPNGFGGDLRYGEADGLAGADKICRELAEDSSPGAGCKTWRAFLSVTKDANGDPVNAGDRIGEGPWYDRLERPVAMSKDDLLQTWPEGADPLIVHDLPNEFGVPNHDPDGNGQIDNHNTITGTGPDGVLTSTDWAFTCHDWTSKVGEDGTPRIGFSWLGGAANMNGSTWYTSNITEGGCAPIVNTTNDMDFSIRGIGARGGYGGFYCLALEP